MISTSRFVYSKNEHIIFLRSMVNKYKYNVFYVFSNNISKTLN